MSVHRSDSRRLFSVMLTLLAVVTFAFWVFAGITKAEAALYGGMVALTNSWMLRRRVARALEVMRRRPGLELMLMVTGAMQRFIMTIALFLLGMGVLKLEPIPLVATFAIAQVAYVVAGALAAIWPEHKVKNL